jgi:cell wall-associated NlpC family hydrolase
VPLDRRVNAFRDDLADERLRGQVDAPRFVAGETGVIVAPSAPLRRAPRDDAPLDTEALAGERARVFETKDGWCWLQLERDGYVGYAPAAALGAPGPAPTHRVAVPRAHVYPQADIKTPPLSWLPCGAEVAATPLGQRFAKLAGGGYAIARHLAPLDAPAPDPVAVAESFLAVPYLWGGKTALGIDCSGLQQVALAAAGHRAPRDSDMLARWGRDATAAPRARGDMLFWSGHCGMLRDAATLLHANAHHMQVAVEPLDEALARIGPPVAIRRPN